jgi:hypothetical protein
MASILGGWRGRDFPDFEVDFDLGKEGSEWD